MNIAKRKKPDLQEQPELMQVKLTLHIQNEPINEPINEPVNEPVNERQQTILSIMKQNPSIIREDLANKLGISLATLKRELTSLRKEGYITRSGSDKNGQWIVVSK
ncbi:winged helix-turn-helix transcriptional regulator [uncultured Prevotella sp.]|uniref:winged helix-turn-helix transcriptional regulator n=1 Tax=uncultured Prevotella sp. TaxID=159272 RepID=UPI00262E452F|nr:winged helix-turn-helix transcriptional regulator [uncultured Prevotella sp.]